MLREDDERMLETPKTDEILQNASTKFENYFVAPSSSKSSTEQLANIIYQHKKKIEFLFQVVNK